MEQWWRGAAVLCVPDEDERNQYVDFIQEFDYTGGEAVLFIHAHSGYAAWLGGEPAGCLQYADYAEYPVFDALPVTGLLRPGKNRLAVTAYCQGEDSLVCRARRPALLFALYAGERCLAASGEETRCRLSPAYRSGGQVDRITGQLSYSFRYDGTRDDGWRCGETADGWRRPALRPAPARLFPRPVKRLTIGPPCGGRLLSQGTFAALLPEGRGVGDAMQRAALRFLPLEEMTRRGPAPLRLPDETGIPLAAQGGDGLYLIIDLEREEAGLLEIELELPRPAWILVGFGEHLDDLRVRTAVGGRQFAAACRLDAGRRRFCHPFKRLGCRYLQLFIYAEAAVVYRAGLLPAAYPVTDRGGFGCSDGLHGRIYAVGLRTLELCMHEHYEDCPWREQALYAMDSRNQMLCGYYAFGETAFPKASLRLLALGQRENGLLEMCAPARWGVTIPAFSLCYIVALYEYWLFSGDDDFAAESLPCAARILGLFEARTAANGLVPAFREPENWNFYEWADGLDGGAIFREEELPERFDAPLNAFLLLAVERYARLCRVLGQTEAAGKAARWAARLRQACGLFWEGERGLFATYLSETGERLPHYAELTQALLVCAGAAGEREEAVLRRLAAGEGLVPVTLSCTIYKYEALLRRPEVHGRAVFADVARRWGGMLFAGATSLWETEKGAWDFDNAGSLCHGWSAVPVYLYYAYALGWHPEAAEPRPVEAGLYELRGAPALDHRPQLRRLCGEVAE